MASQKDNALGAPAEGFSQTVTFARQPEQRTVLLEAPPLTNLQAGIQGSPVAQLTQSYSIDPPSSFNPTLKLLQNVAGGTIDGYLNRKKAEAFVSGMQRAAAGEAVQDIAAGAPWYTRIFGESDVIEGARQYTAQAKAASLASAVEDGMAEIRKLGAPEANAYFTGLVNDHLTGDGATDAALMQSFARMLPGTMRRQAKEHYAWKQEEASKAESSAFLAAAELIQKRAGSDKQTDDEYATNAVQFIASMRPAEGRDLDSWTKARTADMLALAQAGKFHAVNAVRHSGMLDLLPTEARTKIESALDTAENRAIANKSFEYAGEIGRIAGQAEVYSTDLNPADTLAQLRALNERFRKETGIDRDLIGLDRGTGVIKDVHTTLLREGERRIRQAEQDAKDAAKEGDKERAKAVLRMGALQAISMGHAGAATRAEHMKPVVDEQFLGAYRTLAAKGPAAQAQMLMQNYTGAGTGDGYVNGDIRDMFERRVAVTIGAQMPADFLKVHEEYAALKEQSPALADAYFGKMADRMAVFDSLLTDGKPGSRNEAMAFTTAFGSQEPPRFKPLDKKERVEAAKAIATQHDSPDWKFWKQQRTPLRDDQVELATDDLGSALARFRSLPGTGIDAAAQRAFALRQREAGADMVGGFYIRGAAGQQPLTNILRTMRPGDSAKGTGEDAPDVWDKAVKGKVEQLASRYGFNTSDPITILRNPDRDGVAWLDVYFTPPNGGAPVPVRLSSDDIKNYARDPKGRTVGGPVTQGR